MKAYFMVHREDGSAPTCKHFSFESALAEAERLARKTGKRFVILGAVGYVQPAKTPVEYRLMDAEDL